MTGPYFRLVLLPAGLLMVLAAAAQSFELHGHRGARGLAPENTLAAFQTAISIGVTYIETDLAVTADDVVVISHDPLLNPDLVRNADGKWIAAPGPAIRSLSLAQLRTYDVGRLNQERSYARQWPQQIPADGQRFPTLAELFELARRTAPAGLRFNIEIKTSPLAPQDAPDPATFARLALAEIERAGMADRVVVQSFDWRALDAVRRLSPRQQTSCLTIESANFDTVDRGRPGPSPWLGGRDVDELGGSVPRAARSAGCQVWSPFWRNVTADAVREAHQLGLRVLPWTVNDPAQMATQIDLGVDGLITDYPDRLRRVMVDRGMAAP